jgi:Fe-S oxidoreductase
MPLAPGDVIGILSDNLRLRKSVLPISTRSATRWARGLNLPRGGETVLYTGQMYQLIPYIEHMVTMEARVADSWLSSFTGLGRRVNRFVNLTAFMGRPTARARTANNAVLRNVVLLLRQAEVTFGYLYEDDLYSGALAHDLGADEALAMQARRVYRKLKQHGVRTVITVDPHTTNMLRSVYPRVLKRFDVQVRSYLEVLAEQALPVRTRLAGRLAIHDSCVYSRSENVVQQPRALLERAGVAIAEPKNSAQFTWCCGGPVEALYPHKALAMAQKRVEQLRQAAPDGVTMCPLCLVNLRKAAGGSMSIMDISEYLRRAYIA